MSDMAAPDCTEAINDPHVRDSGSGSVYVRGGNESSFVEINDLITDAPAGRNRCHGADGISFWPVFGQTQKVITPANPSDLLYRNASLKDKSPIFTFIYETQFQL